MKALASLITEAEDLGTQPYIALESVESGTGRLISPLDLPERELPDAGAASARSGDVLFGKLRPYLAKTWLADRSAYVSTELLCIRPGALLDSRWLSYLVSSRSFVQWSVATSDGARMPRTSWEKLAQFRTAIPPLPAQRAIADYLDRNTGRIDALIEAKRAMVRLIAERFSASRVALVVDSDASDRQPGPAWLGSIPSNWNLMRLKFVASMESGHTPNRQLDAYWIDCTIPWLTLNDVGDLEATWRFSQPRNGINQLGLENSSARILPADAVAMSRDATVGKAALLGRPMAVSQHFVAWVCGPDLLPAYLLNVIRGPMQHLFGSLTAGATITTIGMPDLNQLIVPVPPLIEQRRIVTRLEEIERRATETQTRLQKQIAILRERRDAGISAALGSLHELADAA